MSTRYDIITNRDPVSIETDDSWKENELLKRALAAEIEIQRANVQNLNTTRTILIGPRRSGKTTWMINDLIQEITKGNRILFCSVTFNMVNESLRDIPLRNELLTRASARSFYNRSRGMIFSTCYFDEILFYNIDLSEFFTIIEREIQTKRLLVTCDRANFVSYIRHDYRTGYNQFVSPWSQQGLALNEWPERFENWNGRMFYHQGVPWELFVLDRPYR